MSELKVSVIIPSYNYENYISIAIDSVLNQSYKNIELIVVDDCSSDNSQNIISSYGHKLIPVFHEKNVGHGGAFNSGFEMASGDIITFLDADDFLNAGAIQTIVNNYSPEIVMYQYYLDLVDLNGNKFDIYPKKEIGLGEGNVSEIICSHGGFLTTVTSGMSFSKLGLNNVMPMNSHDYRQGGDGYLAITVPLYGPVKVINNCLASYRQHNENHSKFGQALSKRACWCVGHMNEKFNSLRLHANKLEINVIEPLGHKNLKYLEQLMVLNLLGGTSETKHVVNKKKLVSLALAVLSEETNNKHNVIIKLWWKMMGILPKKVARSILQWKLEAKSRPIIIKKVSKILRG